MLHVCDQRFDVTGNLEIFCELKKALVPINFNLTAYIYKNNNYDRIHEGLSSNKF